MNYVTHLTHNWPLKLELSPTSSSADQKRAALNPTSSQPLNHTPLKSARIRNIKTAAKEQWRKEWYGNKKTSNKLRHITKQRGVKSGAKLYNTLPSRRAVATLVRLCTGYCKLNHYMHRFKIKDSPYCECGNGKETVEHYLLESGSITNGGKNCEEK